MAVERMRERGYGFHALAARSVTDRLTLDRLGHADASSIIGAPRSRGG
jgi:hypothetical protein